MSSTPSAASIHRAERDPTRRNVILLALALACAMTGNTIVVTTAALVGHVLAPEKELATLPFALQLTATMLTTIPASLLMGRIGRRAGFAIGAITGFTGATLAAYAIVEARFTLLIVGHLLLGGHMAFVQFYRFAAADTADDAFRAKAISLVMGGGVAAAIFGPELAKWSQDLLAPALFAGCYAVIAALTVVALAIVSLVKVPRPKVALGTSGGRGILEIARQPAFAVAVLAGAVGYGVMTLIMTATPLAMDACGYAFGTKTFVIQWHVLGMFVPSFFTGHLIRRFGVLRVMAAGAALVAACAGINLSGIAVWQFWSALVLLGLGWNFLYVGGSALLVETYRPEEKAKTQALNDFLVFSASASAAFLSGYLHSHVGWEAVNLGVLPAIGVILAATLWLRTRRLATA